jgi:hypothetical protein
MGIAPDKPSGGVASDGCGVVAEELGAKTVGAGSVGITEYRAERPQLKADRFSLRGAE